VSDIDDPAEIPGRQISEAMMLIALDRTDEAEELLRRSLRATELLGDRDAGSRALEGLGLIASRRGRFERAVELLERSLELAGDPDPEERFELYRELARLHGEGTNLPRAIELLESSLATMRARPDRDPAKLVGYTLYLSYAYSDMGDYGHAGAVLTDALREDAEEIDRATRSKAYRALSRLYGATGHTSLAVDYARMGVEAVQETGDDWEQAGARLLLAHVLLDDGQADAAARELASARRCYGERMSAMDEGFLTVEEARRALQQGDPEGAAALAREAIELLGNLSVPGQLGDAYLVLARSYDETGRSDRAEAAYTAAIDALRKQNGWHCELGRAYRWYGKFLRRAGRAEAAMEAFEHAADLAPSNHEAGPPRP
jgi:tetratricopeptide (TPR) repeat protein